MSQSTTTRTVRFNKKEMNDIEDFLRRNSFFDFSNQIRVAVAEYIRNPKLQINPIRKEPSQTRQERKREVNV